MLKTTQTEPAEAARPAGGTTPAPAGEAGSVTVVVPLSGSPVFIEGIDLNTCCGTHLRSTAEIEVVKLLSTESLRGGVRLTFVAGGRARVRLGRFEVQNAALRAALGAPDEGLVEAARDRVARLVHSERRVRSLLAELAEASADALGEGSAALVSGHWEGKDGAFLSAVAKRFVERHPGRAAFLTATEGERLSAVIVAGEGFPVEPVDWQSAGRDAMALLGGRGGGTGRLFQGKAPVQKSAAAAREAALERMRRLV